MRAPAAGTLTAAEARENLPASGKENRRNTMKMLVAALAAAALLVGCQSSNTGASPPSKAKNFKYSMDDGSTQQTAVEVRTRSNTEGSNLMREWIRANYPGYTIAEQQLMRDAALKKM